MEKYLYDICILPEEVFIICKNGSLTNYEIISNSVDR